MSNLVAGLIEEAARVARARYYVALENRDSSSGFHPDTNKRAAAIEQAESHLRRFRVWQTARVYNRDTNALVKTIHQEQV